MQMYIFRYVNTVWHTGRNSRNKKEDHYAVIYCYIFGIDFLTSEELEKHKFHKHYENLPLITTNVQKELH